MSKQKMLHVKWTESEEATFYVDKDEYSRAHEHGDTITLNSFSGIYKFHKHTKAVTLDTGIEVRRITVVGWKFFEAPEPVGTL